MRGKSCTLDQSHVVGYAGSFRKCPLFDPGTTRWRISVDPVYLSYWSMTPPGGCVVYRRQMDLRFGRGVPYRGPLGLPSLVPVTKTLQEIDGSFESYDKGNEGFVDSGRCPFRHWKFVTKRKFWTEGEQVCRSNTNWPKSQTRIVLIPRGVKPDRTRKNPAILSYGVWPF